MDVPLKHVIVLQLQLVAVFSDIHVCLESIPTVSYVPACPENEEQLLKAKQRKQCENLANFQSCTKPADFRYHCLPNSWRNGTVEVCAPVIFSQGYCIKFDEGGSQLQELYDEDCTKNNCSKRFLSSELLHYKQCNIIIKEQRKNKSKAMKNNSNTNTMMVLAIVFGACFIISLVVFCTWRLYIYLQLRPKQNEQVF